MTGRRSPDSWPRHANSRTQEALRHAFAHLELDAVQRLEQECSIWRANTGDGPGTITLLDGADAKGQAS